MAPAAPSIISRDLRIVGDLHSEGEVQIDGGVEGDIRADVLLIGETADIRGEIVADTVHVHGRLTGQIRAKSVNLAATAHVIGDILHEDLAIETGAFLEGHCKRIVEETKPKTVSHGKDPAKASGAAEGGDHAKTLSQKSANQTGRSAESSQTTAKAS